MEASGAALPTRFNFAQHLAARNASRAAKVAYIDDAGTLTYGALAQRAGRVAAALRASGVRREERVFLCLLDTVDFPRCSWARCTPASSRCASTRC